MMGALFSVLAYLAIAGAIGGSIVFAWTGFSDWIGAPYTEAQRTADEVQVNAAKAATKAAEGQRDQARINTQSCITMAAKQADAVIKSETDAKVAIDASKELRKQQKEREKQIAPAIAGHAAYAIAAPKLMECQVELGKAKVIMRNALEAKRGLPITGAPAAPPTLVK